MNIGEMIGGLFILIICTAPVVIIGIVQFNSKNPVGFWSGKEPPKKEQIIDVRGYNRRHGIMWILYGTGMDLCFLSGYFLRNFLGDAWGYVSAVLVMAEVFAGLLGMIAYHNHLDRKYLTE
ncbi:MAG: hypothetical protein HFJ05_08990 [Eubacterium sp.]|nr:hypothetical protein [Eubacterium sp.]